MKIEAVIFDMDGLMLDTERVIQYTWDVVGERLGYHNFGENIYDTMGLNLAARERFFKDKYGSDFPFSFFLDSYREEFRIYVQKYGIEVKKGLYVILNNLKRLGIPMVVATSSSRENAIKHLEEKNVLHYFQGIICGDMVNEAKPSPEIYLKACSLIGVVPQNAIALEDSIKGIQSAYAAGLMPVIVPDLVKDTSEVDELLFAKRQDLLQVSDMISDISHKVVCHDSFKNKDINE